MMLEPGDLKLKDPSSTINAQFDLDAHLAEGITITDFDISITVDPDSALIISDETVDDTSRKVNYVISGGTRGKKYRVTCEWTTSETPPETDQRSIWVKVEDL